MSELIHHQPPVLTFDGHVPAVKGYYNLYDAFAESGVQLSDQMAKIELISMLDDTIEEAFKDNGSAQYAFRATYQYGPISGRLDHETGVLNLNTYKQVPHIKLRLRLHVWR